MHHALNARWTCLQKYVHVVFFITNTPSHVAFKASVNVALILCETVK